MERIVYPRRTAQRREMLYNTYAGVGSLRKLPPLPDLPPNPTEIYQNQSSGRERKERSIMVDRQEGEGRGRMGRSVDNYRIIDAYGRHGWVEGPELEDYCSRLGSVITCFEEVLIKCDNGHDFFRYRHLLHSLARVHQYLCHTAHDRTTRFLPFLKVIDCAENARLDQRSCHRPNVTVNVWNQILRLELGPELCDSLNTQRSCLLENNYVHQECGGPEKEELYRNVSSVFLSTWCRLPLHPYIFSSSSHHLPSLPFLLLLTLLFLVEIC